MLDIVLSATDDQPIVKLSFEHSLLSISKWESMHLKPFYGREAKTQEESQSYIKCMLLTEDPPENFIDRLETKDYEQIAEYLNSPQSGTTFGTEPEKKGPSEVITSELIYYWLVQFKIPFYPTETWHINRLMNLVKITGLKQAPPKKMNKKALAEQYRAMNEKRRQQLGTAG